MAQPIAELPIDMKLSRGACVRRGRCLRHGAAPPRRGRLGAGALLRPSVLADEADIGKRCGRVRRRLPSATSRR
jgi:hypothetical protein